MRPLSSEKRTAARRTMPSGGRLESVLGELERVTRSHLKYAGLPLNYRLEIGPVCGRIQIPQRGIAGDAGARTASVGHGKGLMVGDVKHIPTELQLVFFTPWHD